MYLLMPKLQSIIADTNTKLSKRFIAILGVLKYRNEPVGMSRTNLIKELKKYGVNRNLKTIDGDIKFLKDFNAVEYKEKLTGDRFERIIISSIGNAILTGEFEIESEIGSEETLTYLDITNLVPMVEALIISGEMRPLTKLPILLKGLIAGYDSRGAREIYIKKIIVEMETMIYPAVLERYPKLNLTFNKMKQWISK